MVAAILSIVPGSKLVTHLMAIKRIEQGCARLLPNRDDSAS
jgi:hypothetical protein